MRPCLLVQYADMLCLVTGLLNLSLVNEFMNINVVIGFVVIYLRCCVHARVWSSLVGNCCNCIIVLFVWLGWCWLCVLLLKKVQPKGNHC